MDRLPPELLRTILLASVGLCRCEKNELLPLRLVCKGFDAILKEYIFRTIQLEFSRFARGEAAPELESIAGIGQLCEALYCDMMVIRDEEEIDRLVHVFNSIIQKVPEMTTLLDSLRQYCMNENTFDETDFKRVMDGVLLRTPNMTRLKLNLPFQVIGRASRTATLLLATTFASLAHRPDGFKALETLVLDHVSDSTILDICRNPIDLAHTLQSFRSLKNLVLSIKRQESSNSMRTIFANSLWMLISEGRDLESLCIIGWNTKRSLGSRRHRAGINLNDWQMKSLPYLILDEGRTLKHLRYLELKRIDIDPHALQHLIEQNSTSLKELYLNEVYLKVFSSIDQDRTALWIGHGNDREKPAGCCWLAETLRDMESLNLDVLRATGLGYDDYQPDRMHGEVSYDLDDPSGLERSFDERFVEVVLGIPQALKKVSIIPSMSENHSEEASLQDIPVPPVGTVVASIAPSPVDECQVPAFDPSVKKPQTPSHAGSLRKFDYDVETFQRYHNTTSHWKRCIDGLFYNHNEKALVELQKIIGVADRGMSLLSDEIDRIHAMTHIPREER